MESGSAQADINRPASVVLTWGFRISAALLIVGLAVSAIQDEALHTSLEGASVIIDELADGNGASIVALAILVMIASPIVSATAIAVSLFQAGDRRYAKITAAVLAILLISATISAL